MNETPDSNTAFDSSDSKSIASAVVNSTQSDRTIHLNVFRDNNGVPTPRTNTDGAFELFKKNDSADAIDLLSDESKAVLLSGVSFK